MSFREGTWRSRAGRDGDESSAVAAGAADFNCCGSPSRYELLARSLSIARASHVLCRAGTVPVRDIYPVTILTM